MKSITLVFCKVLICRCIVFRKITLTYSLATSVPFSCGIFVVQGHVCRYCQNKGILFEKRTQFHLSRETISLHLSIWDIGLLCQLCNQYKYPIRFPLVFSYWAQNEAYMCRSAENVVRRLCFNKLCTVG